MVTEGTTRKSYVFAWWHSGVTSLLTGLGTIWHAEYQIQLGCFQGKCPTCCIIFLASEISTF